MKNKFFEILNFFFKNNIVIILGIIISSILIGVITECGKEVPVCFSNFWDPLFSLFSIVLILGISIYEVQKDWIKQLDAELIVHFKYKGNFVLSAYGANLLPGADIRALSQQIGSQMYGAQLKFNPSIHLIKADTLKVNSKEGANKWVYYYEVEIYLVDDEYNGLSYRIWNINNDSIEKKCLKEVTKSFHESKNISLNDMLSYDENNFEKFKNILSDDECIKKK